MRSRGDLPGEELKLIDRGKKAGLVQFRHDWKLL